MVASNELRVGNIIGHNDYDYANDENEIHFTDSVYEIHSNGVNLKDEFGNCSFIHYDNAIPIPLTPEILEKCGFVKIKDGLFAPDIYRKTYTNIAIEYSFDVYIDSDCLFYSGMSIVHLYFLHQLQNLYWCLCGEELKINL